MPRFHPLTVTDVRPETTDAVSIAFAVPKDLAGDYAYRQGQHLTFRAEIGGEEVRRSYSICTGVDDHELRIAVKKVPGGQFSTFAHEALKPGSEIEVMSPTGRFSTDLDPDAARTYVAFASGSGITPVMSNLKTILKREPKSRFVLVYGNRTPDDIIFRRELEALKNRFMDRFSLIHVLSRQTQETELNNGRIDADKVRMLCKGPVRPSAVDAWFICGPGTMIQTVSDTLEELGVARERIHFELFTTETAARRAPERPLEHAAVEGSGSDSAVTVICDGVRHGVRVPFNGDAVLDVAMDQGVELPFSCKAGVCSTCRAKVLEGKVDMAQNYALEDWELEAGFVLTCQSRPLTDTVVLDYDQT